MIRKLRDSMKGFTLMEALVSIMLMAILSGIIAVVVGSTFNSMGAVADRKQAMVAGVHAINMFERDLLTMSDDQQLIVADDQQIRFTNNFGRTVEYTVTADSLMRQIIGAGNAEVIAVPVVTDSTTFHYYAQTNTEFTSYPLSAANREATRLIELRLKMDDGNSGVKFISRVFPENLKILD